MIFLDTHVAIWLYGKELARLSAKALDLIERHPLRLSPMVKLELHLLHELNKITEPPDEIIRALALELGLQVCDVPFGDIVEAASSLTWTRDPFDRLIVAQAQCEKARLLTRDQTIRDNYSLATW